MKIGPFILGFEEVRQNTDKDEERPVKIVEERPNVWRVVYADSA